MKSGKPRPAPKVKPPSKAKPNFMKEADTKERLKSPMWPMKQKTFIKMICPIHEIYIEEDCPKCLEESNK